MSDFTHTGNLRLSPHTWDLIRGHFISGVSGSQLAARFGISASTIAKRAKREGWRRCDLAARGQLPAGVRIPGAPPPPASAVRPETGIDLDVDPDAPREAPLDLAQLCLRAVGTAVRGGRLDQAIRLGRLIETLLRLSTAPVFSTVADDRARRDRLRAELEQRLAGLLGREEGE